MEKNQSTHELTPLLDYKRAAHYLNLSISTLQHMVGRNEIPHIRLKGSIRFDKVDLEAFISENKFPKK